MRQSLLVFAVLATFLGLAATPAAARTATTGTAAATSGAARTAAATSAAAETTTTTCVSAANAGYRHSFNGAAGTATVTATRPLCGGQSQAVTLVSYTAGGTPGTAAGQFVYDSATGKLTGTNRSLTLKVAVPGCYAQVVAFFGAGIQTELTSTAAPYGSAKLSGRSTGPLTWYAGGTSACTATPTITYTYACDGTFTATLANGAGTNTSAVFLTGSRRIRLSPGRSTTVKATKGGTLTVRDSSFTTHVASWQSPATGCATTPTQAPTQAPAIPPAQPATTTLTPSAPASTTATPTTTATTATDPAYDAPVAYPTFPDKTASAKVAAAAKSGMGTGSVVLIALGLLMVGAGIAAIIYLIRLNRSPA